MIRWLLEIIKKVIINVLTFLILGAVVYFFIIKPLLF
jgi:preprotein translocase subunit YajC